jgi:hypothetical protein
MDGGTSAELLSPAEAEWPPELRLPPPPPVPAPRQPKPEPNKEPSPPRHAEGFDDQHFLGSIMAAAAQHVQPAPVPAAEAPVKRKRGRPPKNRDGAAPAPTKPPVKKKKKDEEIVCFICFDGGELVVCDRRCGDHCYRSCVPEP